MKRFRMAIAWLLSFALFFQICPAQALGNSIEITSTPSSDLTIHDNGYYEEAIIHNSDGEEILITVSNNNGILEVTDYYHGSKGIYRYNASNQIVTTMIIEDDICTDIRTYQQNPLDFVSEDLRNRIENQALTSEITRAAYVNIGSVTYNPNSNSGEILKLDIYSKQTATYDDELFNLNETLGERISIVIGAFISAADAAGYIGITVTSVATALFDAFIIGGVIFMTGAIVTGVTADSVECVGAGYRIQTFDTTSGRQYEFSGKKYRVLDSSHRCANNIYCDDVYPQFLEDEDDGVAGFLFAQYRDTNGYNGVDEYYAKRTIPFE